MRTKLLVLLTLLLSFATAQTITVAEARQASEGDTVTVAALVTSIDWSGGGYLAYHLQDNTAGIYLYNSSNFSQSYAIGDSLLVTGELLSYNGLLEIVPFSLDSLVYVSSGNDLPVSQPMTMSALLSDPESVESEIVVIENVSVVGGDAWPAEGNNAYDILVSDDGGVTTMSLKIDKDTDIDGSTQPAGAFSLTAIIGQYDSSDPYTEGYELLPRSLADVADPPAGVVTFAEARADSGGTYTVRGFVNTPPFAFSRTDVGFQDATGGLNLFVYSDYMEDLEYGDFVEATGTIIDYNGKRELDCGDTANITILYKGALLPPPLTMTIAEILAAPETYEGMIVKVLNATYDGTWPTASGGFDLIDPSDTMDVYIDSDMPVAGMSAPVGAFNMTGWLGQYYSHQIQPRFTTDVETFTNQAPVIVNVTYDPQPVYDMDDVTITAEITDDGNFTATLNYDIGAGFVTGTFAHDSGDLYTATIPGQAAGTLVEYFVSVDDGELSTTGDTLSYLVLASGGSAIPISDIQYSASGPSPLDGQPVTVSGIITAEFWGSYGNRYFYVQDSVGAWSGVVVFEYGGWDSFDFNSSTGTVHSLAEGDSVSISGTVDEYWGLTEIVDVTSVTIYGKGTMPDPITVTCGQVNTDAAEMEAYEGVLVKVEDVVVAEGPDDNYEWTVTDGTDTLKIDVTWEYYYWPEVGDTLAEIVGVMDYTYSEAKLQPRLARDVVESNVTRIQRIQQVLYSDLLKTGRIGSDGLIDHTSDISYMAIQPGGDTTLVTIEGVVTMPTELGYAGAGIKVIYEDVHGGPWSGILSYDPDSTGIPIMWEGDTVRAVGYIDEYDTDHGNMTEIFGMDVPDVIGYGTGEHGVGIPPVEVVPTGDLRWPETAEQWGNVMIRLEDMVVTATAPAGSNLDDGMFAVDDGTGEVWIDHDSWVIEDWWDLNGPPAVGTAIDSITGWVYHHFGTYSETGVSTYKVVPLYLEDISLIALGADKADHMPNSFALHQNYPNPFNPSTRIQFDLANGENVKLIVYDVLGRQVRTLVSGNMDAGSYTVNWNGQNNAGQAVSTGVYFVRMVAGDYVSVTKMTLLR